MKCIRCHNKIDMRTKECSNCGAKYENKKEKDATAFIVLEIIIVIVFTLLFMYSLRGFFYKEGEATLISYSSKVTYHDDEDNTDYYDGIYEYYVSGKKYQIKKLISSGERYKGNKIRIYYDQNNPEKNALDKSITVSVVLAIIDLFMIIGTYFYIKDSLALKLVIDTNNDTNKYFNHKLHGKVEYYYDSIHKFIELYMKEDGLIDELSVYIPKEVIDDFLNKDDIKREVLNNYDKISDKDLYNIKKILIDKEIDVLNNWYDFNNTINKKQIFIDKGELYIHSISTDNKYNIVNIGLSYSLKDDEEKRTFNVEYNCKTKEIEYFDSID